MQLAGADGTRQVHEVGAGERSRAGPAAAALGLSLEEGKAILAAVQVEEHCGMRPAAPHSARPGAQVSATVVPKFALPQGRVHQPPG